MPEMTKGTPEGGDPMKDAQNAVDNAEAAVQTAERKVAQAGKACPDCGKVHGKGHGLAPGSRSWFWSKRIEHMMLWIAPGAPLLVGTTQLLRPQVTVTLDGKDRAAINRVYDMPGIDASTVRSVTVRLDDPGIVDRLIAAGPSLLFGALLMFVAYALWRIEINLSATGKYTPKDGRVLAAASRWLWHGWWFIIASELAIGFWWRDTPGTGTWYLSSVATPFDHASLMTLMITAVVAIITRIYRNGAKAYAELERAV